MSHLGQVPSVGPFLSHGLSMPSVSMELTQLLTSNALQGQSLPSVSTTHDHFINNDVSTNTVSVENCVTNAENWIVCRSKLSVVNFDSNAHSHFNSNSLTNDKTNDIISRSSENFSDVSGQHISNLSSTKLLSNSEANESDNLIGVIPSIKDKHFSQESHFDEFECKLDSRFDQLYADMCNLLEKYCAGCFATQHETHDSINKIQSPVSPVSGTNPSEKGDHYRKSGDSEQPLVSANISGHQVEKTVSQVDGSDVTGKLENISHNSHNSKFTDNTFDIQHESHNSLKMETSNMDKSIPVKMSMKNSSEERSHRGAFPRDQMKNACFHCRKLGHFAYECPDLCPPSRADKDSNWRHSMKQRNIHESKNGYRHFNQSPAQNSIDKHNVPSVQINIISDISIIPQPQKCTVQKEIPVEHNITSLGPHNSICDNVDLSHPKSNEHMDENSDSDICGHNFVTSDIPDKSDNQQINEHTDSSTPSLQINPDVRHHDSFASSVIGSLTSDNTYDDNITNSIKAVCPDPSTQHSVRLSDAICDAQDTNDTNIGSVTPDVIAIKTVGDTLHDDDTDMNSVPLGVNEMLSEAYRVGSYIRELLEDMVDFIIDHHVQESLVKCHGEDLPVDHNADSVVNLDDDASIIHHSDDESNDSDQHYEYPDGVGFQFEISNDVRHHTNTLSENDTTISGNFSTCLADVNILSSDMGGGDLSNNYHHVLFSDGANDFGNLCHNQRDANFVTLAVLLSSTFLQCLQAINDGVNGIGLAKTYLCTKLFYVKKIRHRKEIYQLNS